MQQFVYDDGIEVQRSDVEILQLFSGLAHREFGVWILTSSTLLSFGLSRTPGTSECSRKPLVGGGGTAPSYTV